MHCCQLLCHASLTYVLKKVDAGSHTPTLFAGKYGSSFLLSFLSMLEIKEFIQNAYTALYQSPHDPKSDSIGLWGLQVSFFLCCQTGPVPVHFHLQYNTNNVNKEHNDRDRNKMFSKHIIIIGSKSDFTVGKLLIKIMIKDHCADIRVGIHARHFVCIYAAIDTAGLRNHR